MKSFWRLLWTTTPANAREVWLGALIVATGAGLIFWWIKGSVIDGVIYAAMATFTFTVVGLVRLRWPKPPKAPAWPTQVPPPPRAD